MKFIAQLLSLSVLATIPVGLAQAQGVSPDDRLHLFLSSVYRGDKRASEADAQGQKETASHFRNLPIKDMGLTPAEAEIVHQYAEKVDQALKKKDQEIQKRLEPLLAAYQDPDPAKRPQGPLPGIAAAEAELDAVRSQQLRAFEAAMGQEGMRKVRANLPVVSTGPGPQPPPRR